MPSSNNVALKEANRLAEYGYYSVPCEDKRALIKDWPERILSADEQKTWHFGKHRNIGAQLNLSGLTDIEYDFVGGEEIVLELFDGEIPPTPTFRSPRGLHRLFQYHPQLPDKAKIAYKGVEIRGCSRTKGALSIFPPSGGRQWEPGLSIYEVAPAEFPLRALEKLREKKPAQVPSAVGDKIREGRRNDELFKKACALRDVIPAELLLSTLLELNAQQNDPPLLDSEVKVIHASALRGEKPGGNFLERFMEGIKLWHDKDRVAYATFTNDGHSEHCRVGHKSTDFSRRLCREYYKATGKALDSAELKNICSVIAAAAEFDGPELPVYRRVAWHDGKIYLDLCNAKWQAIEIDEDGWRIVDDPPVKFLRSPAMLPLPTPQRTAKSLKALLSPFLNIQETQWVLLAVWMTAALRPNVPCPVLKLNGGQGSAKSTSTRVIRSTIDPNSAPLRSDPASERDAVIAAAHSRVCAFDNISVIREWLSDALCRFVTGGGASYRKLYSDDEETIFAVMVAVILTSIEDIGARSDLLERSVLLELPPIADENRKPEKVFWRDFDRVHGAILGALLDVVSGALRRLPEIEARADSELPRMADFAMWGEACEGPLGLAPGTFREAYEANQLDATHVALESSPLIPVLLKYLAKNPDAKPPTAAELLEELGKLDPAAAGKKGWPRAPKVLSQTLKRIAPNLRQLGIVAQPNTVGGGVSKKKVWEFDATEYIRNLAAESTPPAAAKKAVKKTVAAKPAGKKVVKKVVKKVPQFEQLTRKVRDDNFL